MSNVPCTRSEGLLIFMSSVTETSTSALGKQGEPPLARSTTGAQAHLRTVRHFILNTERGISEWTPYRTRIPKEFAPSSHDQGRAVFYGSNGRLSLEDKNSRHAGAPLHTTRVPRL